MSATRPMGLTRRQGDALRFIVAYIAEHDRPPSYGEIAGHLSLVSKSGVSRLMEGLKERGYVDWLPYKERSLVVLSQPATSFVLPPALQATVDRLARHLGETPSAIVHDAVAAYIDDLGERVPVPAELRQSVELSVGEVVR